MQKVSFVAELTTACTQAGASSLVAHLSRFSDAAEPAQASARCSAGQAARLQADAVADGAAQALAALVGNALCDTDCAQPPRLRADDVAVGSTLGGLFQNELGHLRGLSGACFTLHNDHLSGGGGGRGRRGRQRRRAAGAAAESEKSHTAASPLADDPQTTVK